MDYQILSTDRGGVIPADSTLGSVNITLPSPASGFNVTIKDIGGSASAFPINILRGSSTLTIDNELNDDAIVSNFGAISYISDGTNWFRVSSVSKQTSQTALFGGGYTGSASSSVIDSVAISSLANAVNFGTLSAARQHVDACASNIRAIFGGGDTSNSSGGGSQATTIDFTTFTTGGTATSFGALTTARSYLSGCSSAIIGIFAGGSPNNSTNLSTIDYVTMTTASNATAFGSLSQARWTLGALASQVRGVFCGGYTGTYVNTIDYVTIASAGNATSFGTLSAVRQGPMCASNATIGIVAGGYSGSPIQTIDYITIATTGNGTNFGNLTTAKYDAGSSASSTRAVFGGGSAGSTTNAIDFITIATSGSGASFGTLTVARYGLAGCSNAHGGL